MDRAGPWGAHSHELVPVQSGAIALELGEEALDEGGHVDSDTMHDHLGFTGNTRAVSLGSRSEGEQAPSSSSCLV